MWESFTFWSSFVISSSPLNLSSAFSRILCRFCADLQHFFENELMVEMYGSVIVCNQEYLIFLNYDLFNRLLCFCWHSCTRLMLRGWVPSLLGHKSALGWVFATARVQIFMAFEVPTIVHTGIQPSSSMKACTSSSFLAEIGSSCVRHQVGKALDNICTFLREANIAAIIRGWWLDNNCCWKSRRFTLNGPCMS